MAALVNKKAEVPKILIQYRTQHCTHHTSCPTREKSSHSPCDEIRRGACTNTLAILHKYIGHLAEIQRPPALTGYTAEKAPKYSWKMHQEEEEPKRGLKKKVEGLNTVEMVNALIPYQLSQVWTQAYGHMLY